MSGRNESFFHGTVHDIKGGVVRPGVQVGRENWGSTGKEYGQSSEEHAFATTNEDTAWDFAKKADAKMARRHWKGLTDQPPERARVYTVAPNSQMKPGVHRLLQEWAAPEFKVIGRNDTKPGQQGTFPNINWRQFSHPDISGDPNHPEPLEVERGMQFRYGTGHKNPRSSIEQAASELTQKEVTGQLPLFKHPAERR